MFKKRSFWTGTGVSCFLRLAGLAAIVVLPANGETFEDWLAAHSIPENRAGISDRNGPLQLENLRAYAFGLNPYTATKADIPHLLGMDGTQLRVFYRHNVGAEDVGSRFESSATASDWSAVAPVSEEVLWTENGVEGRAAIFPWDGSADLVLRHVAELVEQENLYIEVAAGTLPEFGGYMPEAIITQPYLLGKYEVTGGEWQKVVDWAVNNGYEELSGSAATYCNENHPVVYLQWYHAIMWCNAKSEMEGLEPVYFDNASGSPVVYKGPVYGPYLTGQGPGSEVISWDESRNGYRLPTYDEWQYAARGGQLTNNFLYAGSNDLEAVAIYADNSFDPECTIDPYINDRGTWPVGTKEPNELGFYDMSGSVWEMLWNPNYSGDPELLRGRRAIGGSWLFGGEAAGAYSVYNYTSYQPVQTASWLGFRLARTVAD